MAESTALNIRDLEVGATLPPLVKPAITRGQLAGFADASGDRNPIHLDDEAARSGGLPGVIAHGMLTMAFLAELLTRSAPVGGVESLDARFVAMAFPGDVITCTGTVTDKVVENGKTVLSLQIRASNQKNETIMEGWARLVV
jgi:acyl dehydratase